MGGSTQERFDLAELTDRLSELPTHRHRLAFGARIAERLFSNYVTFSQITKWGTVSALRLALDDAWNVVGGATVPMMHIKEAQAACRTGTPDSEAFSTPLVSAAIDAASAVHDLLETCAKDSPERIASIASSAYDTVDMFVQDQLGPEYESADFEATLRAHPLVRQELARQQDGIRELKYAALRSGFIDALRQRAELERTFELAISGSGM